jgi:DinB superfamily
MTQTDPLRQMLGRVLSWEDAHVSFDTAVSTLPRELQGRTPPGLPYSPWQLLEHLRITQHDILEFCINPEYEELAWPDDYWPKRAEPPSADAWTASVAAYNEDRDALVKLAANPKVDLFAKVPAGTTQTYLRELLLVADHTAYHVGELVVVRRALGAWPPK